MWLLFSWFASFLNQGSISYVARGRFADIRTIKQALTLALQESLKTIIPLHPSSSLETIDPSSVGDVLPRPNDKKGKISKLHYLVPASRPNLQLCYNLASAAINRYPVPTLLGWNGVGEFDAAITHLAKLRAMKRYLDSLRTEEDDDLVVVVDGYDIIHQLPAEVIIKRYFDIRDKADADLAQRLGVSATKARARHLRQTVFWGPDKVCWPPDPTAARCWAAPPSTLGPGAFGPSLGPLDLFSVDPRWLNSGTAIGPVKDLKRIVDATMDEIHATYDVDFWQSDSDQYYISNIWGRQEYWRNKHMFDGDEINKDDAEDRVIPEKRFKNQVTELHMAIEYESSLFQTKAGNEPFIGYLPFNNTKYTANMDIDIFGQGEGFQPYLVEMPGAVRQSLMRIFDSVPDAHSEYNAEDWIRTVQLGINYITKQIYGLWHCTGPKEFIDGEYPRMWFYPYVMSLLKASVVFIQDGNLVSEELIDGRRWAAKSVYPHKSVLTEEYGGAWSDELPGGRFVAWKELCGIHEEVLFRGEREAGLSN